MTLPYDLALRLRAEEKLKKGLKNPRWKGRDASYTSKHQFLTRNFGKPEKCELCTVVGRCEDGGRWSIHWAKKTEAAEYTHNRVDYLMLCRSCHRKYDMTPEQVAQLKKQLKDIANNQTPEKLATLSEKRRLIALQRARDKRGHFIPVKASRTLVVGT